MTGGDLEQHLTGASAILSASQGSAIDPAAPSVRQAAFWVYVRQCLFTATVNQQPANLDPSLELLPIAPPSENEPPSATLQRETRWSNTMVGLCASVVHFCFDGVRASAAVRMQTWQELWDGIQWWNHERPSTFSPTHTSPPSDTSVFPEIWFASDWHGKCLVKSSESSG